MSTPDKTELETLDWVYNGLPFSRTAAQNAPDPATQDTTYNGLPFYGTTGGGEPDPPPPFRRTYMVVTQSTHPHTASTLGRETGDVLLTDDGFTLLEEDGILASNLPTIELFESSTPTSGSWFIAKRHQDNRSNYLRSPVVSAGGDYDCTLTVVLAALGRIDFDWGISTNTSANDTFAGFLRFYVDDVLQMEKKGQQEGRYSLPLSAGTYVLKWRYHRPGLGGTNFYLDRAWIDNLLIDPTF